MRFFFQRLASRGLVQNVTFATGNSHHVLDVISSTFGPILPEGDTSNLYQAERYHSLRESFIPLRKASKSSRLRLLSSAEMVTSESWTAGFLDSDVSMRVSNGQRRLYLTTREAYLQSREHGWSWEKLRQLRMYGSGKEETCWAYDDRLDSLANSHAPFVPRNSQESQWHDRSSPAAKSTSTSPWGIQLWPMYGNRGRRIHTRIEARHRLATSGGKRGGSGQREIVASSEADSSPCWSHGPPFAVLVRGVKVF